MTAPRPLPTWMPRAGIALALAGLVALSFVERAQLLFASPFPIGVDGYFYPLQVRALLETGALQYPASPLAFWLMLPFAAATDPITGAKLAAALFGALVAVPAYGVGARLGRSRGAGLVAAVLATTSAGSAFLTIEFVKNGLGLTVLLAAVWLLLRALEAPARGRIAAAIAGGVLAFLAHKMAGGLLVAIAVPALVAEGAGRGVLRGRRLLYTIALGVAVTALLLALGSVMPRRLPSPTDATLFGDLVGPAHPRAPALVTPRRTLTFGHEALLGGIAGVLAAGVLSRRGRRLIARAAERLPTRVRGPAPARGSTGETAAAWVIALLAIAIACPWLAVDDAQGLGFRLRIAAYVPMALASAIVAGRLLARLRHRDLVLAALAAALALRTPGTRAEGRIVAHPAMVSAIHALAGEVPAGDTVIVPERHIAFMVAWYARVPVRLQPGDVPAARRWRLLPLAWVGMGSPLDRALLRARTEPAVAPPRGFHARHPNGLVLVPEATYQWALDQVPPETRHVWARWRTI